MEEPPQNEVPTTLTHIPGRTPTSPNPSPNQSTPPYLVPPILALTALPLP